MITPIIIIINYVKFLVYTKPPKGLCISIPKAEKE